MAAETSTNNIKNLVPLCSLNGRARVTVDARSPLLTRVAAHVDDENIGRSINSPSPKDESNVEEMRREIERLSRENASLRQKLAKQTDTTVAAAASPSPQREVGQRMQHVAEAASPSPQTYFQSAHHRPVTVAYHDSFGRLLSSRHDS